MNLPSIIIIILFSILTLLGMIVIGIYSRLSFRRERVLEKFNSINEFLKERSNLMSRVVAIIEMPKYHEDTLIMELEKLNDKIHSETNVNNTIELINKSNKMLKKALSLGKIYPDLKTNVNYKLISDATEDNQTKIMYAIEIYNEEVTKYNEYREKKIISTISKLFRFKDYDKYKK